MVEMNNETKSVELRDGRQILVRWPAIEADLDRLTAYMTGLPAEIRNHLRYDVTNSDSNRVRLAQVDGTDHWRLVAEMKGKIIGDATLDREPFAWTRHVAHMRGVVSPEFAKTGVDFVLYRELIELAAESGVELLYYEVMREQEATIETLTAIGFSTETVRKKYARDLKGNLHDVMIMSHRVEEAWRQLEDQLEDLEIRTLIASDS